VCFVVYKTTLKQERAILTTMYLVGAKNTNIWCVRKEDLQCASPLDVLMAPSPKLYFVANDNNSIDVYLAPGSTILFDSLEFTPDRIGCLTLSPLEWDSRTIFIGMAHSRSPSLHTALKVPSDEGGTALGARGRSGSLGP
jgi:hypothetical protein